MSKSSGIRPYIIAVVVGGAVKAVCLDRDVMERSKTKASAPKRDLASEISGRFGQMHRCDFYRVLGKGERVDLFLIEVTNLVKAAKMMKKEEFEKDAFPLFERLKKKSSVPGFSDAIRLLDELHWERIYDKLCYEHVAKVQATMLVLEEMRQNKRDEKLSKMLNYKNIHYILVLEKNYQFRFIKRFLEKMEIHLRSTVVNQGCFKVMSDKNFDLGWASYVIDCNFAAAHVGNKYSK